MLESFFPQDQDSDKTGFIIWIVVIELCGTQITDYHKHPPYKMVLY